jgi:hypothetical protein
METNSYENGFDTKELALAWISGPHDRFYAFDGWNCEEYGFDDSSCAGWDGYSHRCSCGNRRVCWDVYQSDSGRWFVQGVAD